METTTVPGWPVALRGSLAVAAGLATWGQLRGSRYLRLFPDIYAATPEKPPDLLLRSLAAYRLVEGRGVLAGYSAARLLGAVVAVDRLANVHRFNPDLLLNFSVHYRGSRGNERVPDVLGDAARYSGSPMETRLRLLIQDAGLPRPQVQWVMQDPLARRAVWLDLAWPQHLIGIEYEGEGHARPEVVRRDTGRYTDLVDRGWRIYRYTKDEVLDKPAKIVAQLRRARERTPEMHTIAASS